MLAIAELTKSITKQNHMLITMFYLHKLKYGNCIKLNCRDNNYDLADNGDILTKNIEYSLGKYNSIYDQFSNKILVDRK